MRRIKKKIIIKKIYINIYIFEAKCIEQDLYLLINKYISTDKV